MKKYISVLLIIVMLLSLTSCVFLPSGGNGLTAITMRYEDSQQALVWSAIDGAKSYRLTISDSNKVELLSKNLQYPHYSCKGMAAGSYIASVYAISEANKAISKTATIVFEIDTQVLPQPNPSEPDIPQPNPNPSEPDIPQPNPNPSEPDTPGPNPNPTEPDTPQPNPNPTEPDIPQPNPTEPDTPQPPSPEPILTSNTHISLASDGSLVSETELFYKAGSYTDYVISYDDGVKIDGVLVKALGDSKYAIDSENRRIVIDKSYLSQFTYGTKIALRINYDGDKQTISYLNIVQNTPYAIVDKTINFSKATTKNMLVEFEDMVAPNGIVLKVCIDDMPLSTSYYSLNTKKPTMTIQNNPLFQNLSIGEHKMQIYTDRGLSLATLNVTADGFIRPYDVQLDADNYYPNIYITWKDNILTATKHQVSINGQVYSSDTHPMLFNDNVFNATGLINKGNTYQVTTFVGEDSQASEPKTMYVDVSNATEQKYLTKYYEFLGKEHNYYMTSKEEFKDFMWYFIMHYDEFKFSTTKGYEEFKETKVCLNFEGKVPDNVNELIREVTGKFPEALNISFATAQMGSGFEYWILLRLNMATQPTNKTPSVSYSEYVGNVGHYGYGRATDYDGFKINQITKTATMSTTIEMYMAMERGYRPVPVVDSNAERIYNKAKAVLRTIIDDNMDDFEKVHAIYDWLSNNVVYDHELADEATGSGAIDNITITGNNSFYAEGVFDDGVAVCNGIAIAFDIMCRIEGIECYKIVGKSGKVGHAWNKLKIGDYWYICDATWASTGYSNKQEKHMEEYLFMTTPSSGPLSGGEHCQDNRNIAGDYYAGDANYNVYANTWYITADGEIIDMVARDKADLKKLVDYMSLNLERLYGNKTEYRIVVDCNNKLWNETYFLSTIRVNGWTVTRQSHKGSDIRSDLIFTKS